MNLTEIIVTKDVHLAVKTNCKKQLLGMMSDLAETKTGIASELVFKTLLDRERLGSTGMGKGIAIPHGKFNDLNEITGIFVTLEKPVDFDALDDNPIDTVFLLLAPEDSGADHLKTLAKIARALSMPEVLEKIRTANDKDLVYALLTGQEASKAA